MQHTTGMQAMQSAAQHRLGPAQVNLYGSPASQHARISWSVACQGSDMEQDSVKKPVHKRNGEISV